MTLPSGIDPRLPVLVGVGQHLDRDGGPEPVELILRSAETAVADAGDSTLLSAAEVIAVAPVMSWRYYDPARLLATRWGATPAERWYPAMGGNTPQQLVNKAALSIAEGLCDIAVVCGGESYRTRQVFRRDNRRPQWSTQDSTEEPTWGGAQSLDLGHPAELAHGILMPTQCYPLFESALRHAAGRSAEEHQRFLGELWAGFSAVAASNPYAWDQVRHSAEEIATVDEANRYIGSPYTKRMVSNPDVDMASTLIMCSTAEADRRGIPRERWVFICSGTDGADPFLSERSSMISSPAMRVAGSAALDLAGVGIEELAHLDVYSCFPSAVQLACKELDIPLGRQLTVGGGLCFAGGPWNNPVGHAIATMVDVLRTDPTSIGLVTANGGIIQKHAFGVYSGEPPRSGRFRYAYPQPEIDAAEPGRSVLESYEGPATIESFTVMHERDGVASRAHASVLTPDGHRAWATTSDTDAMATLLVEDLIGATTIVGPDSALQI